MCVARIGASSPRWVQELEGAYGEGLRGLIDPAAEVVVWGHENGELEAQHRFPLIEVCRRECSLAIKFCDVGIRITRSELHPH